MDKVHDVAAHILNEQGTMPAVKLQKLLYYAQAWSLVWDDQPLYRARIEAWANGPVVPDVYGFHRGIYEIHRWRFGNSDKLTPNERGTVDAVLKHYGKMSSQELTDLSHAEDPWRDARRGIPDGGIGKREITRAAMAEYYGSL